MLAVFGINSDGLNLAVNMLILFLVVIYLALVYWTYMDAIRRIEDPMLVICATVASLFPFVGTILYVIVRPPEYLDDIRERELEMQAADRIIQEVQAAAPGSAPLLEAGAAAWLVRANAYTQAALTELMRLRAIDLANTGAEMKLDAQRGTALRGSMTDTLKRR